MQRFYHVYMRRHGGDREVRRSASVKVKVHKYYLLPTHDKTHGALKFSDTKN